MGKDGFVINVILINLIELIIVEFVKSMYKGRILFLKDALIIILY